jgi:hypothetical protein
MRRVGHSWREACALALAESDPKKFIGRLDCAITALQKRYAEWESHALTPAELSQIRKAITALERRMQNQLAEDSAAHSSEAKRKKKSISEDNPVRNNVGHAKHLLRVLRP